MNNESIHIDDLQLTDFAVGELSEAEIREFERGLAESPIANRELVEVIDTVDLLKEAFAIELEENMESFPALRVLPEAVPSNVEEVEFTKSAQIRPMLMSLAAVLTGLLVVGGLVSKGRLSGQDAAPGLAAAESQLIQTPDIVEPTSAAGAMMASSTSALQPAELEVTVDDTSLVDALIAATPHSVEADFISPVSLSVPSTSKDDRVPGFSAGEGYLDANRILPTASRMLLPASQSDRLSGRPVDSFDEPIESSRGRMTFELRKGEISGRLAESMLIKDQRINPDGSVSLVVKSVTHFKGDKPSVIDYNPIPKLTPGLQKAVSSQNAATGIQLASQSPILNPEQRGANLPITAKMTATPEPFKMPKLVAEYQKLNRELASLQKSFQTVSNPSEVKALNTRMAEVIEMSEEVGRQLSVLTGE